MTDTTEPAQVPADPFAVPPSWWKTGPGRRAAAHLAEITSPDEPVIVTTAARMLGVTHPRVSQLKRAGVLPTVGPNVTGAPVSLAAVYRRLAERPGSGPRPRTNPKLTAKQREILGFLAEAGRPVTAPEIQERLGRQVMHSLYRLERLGRIKRVARDPRGRGLPWRWQLTMTERWDDDHA